MATILTFSTQGSARTAGARRDARAEVIVFPRTDIRALHALSDMGTAAPRIDDRPATAPGDDDPA